MIKDRTHFPDKKINEPHVGIFGMETGRNIFAG